MQATPKDKLLPISLPIVGTKGTGIVFSPLHLPFKVGSVAYMRFTQVVFLRTNFSCQLSNKQPTRDVRGKKSFPLQDGGKREKVPRHLSRLRFLSSSVWSEFHVKLVRTLGYALSNRLATLADGRILR